MKKDLEEMLKRLKKWEAENEDADLTQMEEAIDGELAAVRKHLLQQMAQEGEKKEGRPTCPNCGGKMMRNGQKKRELRTKNGEKISLEREQMRCHHCGMTLFPPR